MSKSKKKYAYVIALILIMILFPYRGISFSRTPDVEEGDVIFQTSRSDQSPLIALVTHSPMTHCGIIVMNKNMPYVLEASGTLRLTPLADFIKRGKAGAYWIKHRPKEWNASKKIRYKHLLGRSYDLAFSFSNNRYYCSELVYDIYLNQQGIQLCEPRKMNSYWLTSLPVVKKQMKRRGMNPDDLVVSPSDLFNSSKFGLAGKARSRTKS